MKARMAALMWVFRLSQIRMERGMQLVVRGGDQAPVSAGHSSGARLCARGGRGPGRTGGCAAGLEQASPATETRPEPLPDTLTTGVRPRGAQVRALGGRRFCPASSSKQIYAPVAAASLELAQVVALHAAIAFSSRSAARCDGHLRGVARCRCSRYEVPRSV